ncbi:hypothetical protein F4604DRAFT_1980497 [Suillus subluteus]|nr:hypothetical protein F4604DRAFT_1980497 [Suillus subluteus]
MSDYDHYLTTQPSWIEDMMAHVQADRLSDFSTFGSGNDVSIYWEPELSSFTDPFTTNSPTDTILPSPTSFKNLPTLPSSPTGSPSAKPPMQRLGDTDLSHEIESSVSINVPANEKKRSRTFHTRRQGTALEQSQTVKQLSNDGIAAGIRIGQPDEQKENKFVILPDGIFPSGGGDELGRRSDTYTKPPSPMLSYSPAPSPQNSLVVRERLTVTSKREQVRLFIPTGRTEKAQQDLKVKVAKTELDEWKTTYNTTTTSLQRELDTLKQESQKLKVGLHGLELGNDDLERNEYSSVEISILEDQLTAARSRAPSILTETSSSTTYSAAASQILNPLIILPTRNSLFLPLLAPPSTASSSNYGQSVLLQRAGSQLSKHNPNTSSPSSITRSGTLPTLAASRNSPWTLVLVPRPAAVTASPSVSDITAIPMMASRHKGAQMISKMHARVRNLEQKIHTCVPRLRMDSDSGRQGVTISIMPSTSNISSALSSKSTFTCSEDDKPMDVMAARKDTRPAGVGDWNFKARNSPLMPTCVLMKEILSHELHLPHQVPLIVELMLPSLARDIDWASIPATLMPAAPQPALRAPLSSGLARTGRKIGRPQQRASRQVL